MDSLIFIAALSILFIIIMGTYFTKVSVVLWFVLPKVFALIKWLLSLVIFPFDFGFRCMQTLLGGKLHNARFAYAWEKWGVINSFNNKGLRLSSLHGTTSEQRAYGHFLLLAPTGRGKTTSFIIPNLLDRNNISNKNNISYIITDLAGEIFHNVSGHLNDLGYSIQVINFLEPRKSANFNPLLRSLGDKAKLRKVLSTVVKSVIKGSTDSYWSESAVDLLITISTSCLFHPNDNIKTFANLRFMLSKLQTDELDGFMTSFSPDVATWSDFKSIISLNEKTLSSIISTARTALNLFSIDPAIAHIFSNDTLNIHSLRKSPCALFIICPELRINDYSVALNLVYEEIFSYLLESTLDKDTMPLHILMDEAGNQYIKDLDIILTTCRKRKVSVSLIAQSLSQFQDRYGENKSKTILFGGINTHIILPGLPHQTTKEYSEALGMRTIKSGDNETEKQVPLVSPDELRMMKDAILITGARKPIKFKLSPFFKNRRLRKYSQKPPYKLEESPLITPELLNFSSTSSTGDDVEPEDKVIPLSPASKEEHDG